MALFLSLFLFYAPPAFASGGKAPLPGAFAHFAGPRPAGVVPGCSGTGCDGRDAYTTDCAGQSWDSWWVLDVAYLTDPNTGYAFGYVQLWWSGTCGTNWARYVCLHGSNCPTVTYAVQSALGASESRYDAGGITAQLYLPTTKAQAWAWLDGVPAFYAETGWF
jgi:hypothetical protein